MSERPVRLVPRAIPKIWGATKLEPWHRDAGEQIGEIWLEHPDALRLPLLVKFLYTSEALSVQVHPDDVYAVRNENSCGKTEMWVILRAEPGARIAHGLQKSVSRERLREAALSGEIVQLLNWVPVGTGDVLFTPAGTIHAIGAGIALCEIQQNSDITYRLYDYGRPRELHLEKALDVARLDPEPPPCRPLAQGQGKELLARCKHFEVERLRLERAEELELGGGLILISLEGAGKIAGMVFGPGDAWLIPPGDRCVICADRTATLLAAHYLRWRP